MDRGPSPLDRRGVAKSEAPTIDFVRSVVPWLEGRPHSDSREVLPK